MYCHKLLAALPLLFCAPAFADDGSITITPLATAPAATTRPAIAIMDDWNSCGEALRALLPPPCELTSSETRSRIAPRVIPLLRKSLALTIEVFQASKEDASLRTAARQHYFHILAIMAFLGDEPSSASLNTFRRHAAPENAFFARHAWYLTRWWPLLRSPADAREVLDEVDSLAVASPADDDLTSLLLQMREDLPVGSPLAPQIETIISTHLTGPLAQQAASRFRFADKRRSLLHKPLLVSALTLDGKPFTTRSLAGQTIIVHFGVTSSPQWQIQHNLLQQRYADLPARTAVVTVLCDETDTSIQTHLAQHKTPPWPVIRDRSDPAGFAAQYGVDGFPATIIIGSDGMVRAVDVIPDSDFLDSLALPDPATGPANPDLNLGH